APTSEEGNVLSPQGTPSGRARLPRILHGVPDGSPPNGLASHGQDAKALVDLANNLVAPSHCRVDRTSNSVRSYSIALKI
ncbi:hypothetical protein F443_13264, partial [Phytophthora nicotianae P1569]